MIFNTNARRSFTFALIVVVVVALLSCGKKNNSPQEQANKGRQDVGAQEMITEKEAPAAVTEVADGNEEDEEEVDDEKLKDCPLKLNNPESMTIDGVTEITKKLIELELVNVTQEDAYFKSVRSSCGCLEIVDAVEPQVIKPGGKITAKVMLHGSSFTQSGTYSRALFVECRGCRELSIPVKIIATCLVSVEPSPRINLGTFEGADVNWVRQVTIKILDLDNKPDIELKLPKENKRFQFNLVREEGKNAYRFEIRPKLPMPVGRIMEMIFIPVTGIGENNGVKLAITGDVTGMKLNLSTDRLWLQERDLLEKKTAEVSFLVERAADSGKKTDQVAMFTRGIRTRLPSQQEKAKAFVEQGGNLIHEEEEAVHAQGGRKTWEKLAKTLKLVVPEWIQATPEPQDKGVLYKLVVSDEILKQPNRRVLLTLQNGNQPLRKVELRVMTKQDD